MFRGVGAEKTLEESNGPDGILSEASKKFQEAAALATFNWGNVHMCSARKKMDGGREPPAEEGGNPGAAIASAANFDEVEKDLATAASRFEAALEINPILGRRHGLSSKTIRTREIIVRCGWLIRSG